MEQSLDMAKLAVKALEDKKAEGILVLDIREVSILADYFVIANGTNIHQIQALADHVQEELHKAGFSLKAMEGYRRAGWILMDYTDIVLHIFSKEDRSFYDLEHIWRDGKPVEI
jgi:ribosome-associated protein